MQDVYVTNVCQYTEWYKNQSFSCIGLLLQTFFKNLNHRSQNTTTFVERQTVYDIFCMYFFAPVLHGAVCTFCTVHTHIMNCLLKVNHWPAPNICVVLAMKPVIESRRISITQDLQNNFQWKVDQNCVGESSLRVLGIWALVVPCTGYL